MSAILEELRRLDAARRSGTLSESEFLDKRSALLSRIEDVEFQMAKPVQRKPVRPSEPRELGNGDVANIAIAVIAGAAILTGVGAWLLDDLTLALTLSATVLAAITIRAVQKLDD